MSDLRQNLISEFEDPDYRYAYAESFLNTKVAMQIKTLREQRGKTQAELGAAVGTKQSGFSRFEDVNHSVWKTDTLWKIARALDVRVDISFKTFGSLIDEKEHFNRKSLSVPGFDQDPAFKEAAHQRKLEDFAAPMAGGQESPSLPKFSLGQASFLSAGPFMGSRGRSAVEPARRRRQKAKKPKRSAAEGGARRYWCRNSRPHGIAAPGGQARSAN